MENPNADFIDGIDPDDLLFPDSSAPLEHEPEAALRARRHIELTETLVSQLRSSGMSITYFDTKVRGLVLKTKKHGAQSYYFHAGRGDRTALGPTRTLSLENARAKANRFANDAWRRRGPDTEPAAFDEDWSRPETLIPLAPYGVNSRRTIREIFELYAKDRMLSLDPAWRRQLQRSFENHILPEIGDWRVGQITTERMSDHLDSVSYSANERFAFRYRRALSAMFGWAETANLIDLNSVRGTRRCSPQTYPLADSLRDLAIAYRSAPILDATWCQIVRLHILTGLPLRTVRSLKVEQVYPQDAQLYLSENYPSAILPLSTLAAETLELAIGPREFGPVFPKKADKLNAIEASSRELKRLKDRIHRIAAARFEPRNIRRSIAKVLISRGWNQNVIVDGLRGRLGDSISPEMKSSHPVIAWNEALGDELNPQVEEPMSAPDLPDGVTEEVDL